jgi:hypothetical protein
MLRDLDHLVLSVARLDLGDHQGHDELTGSRIEGALPLDP